MRSRLPRHLRHLTLPVVLLSTAGVLLGTTGVLASTVGLSLGTSAACGCEAKIEFKATNGGKTEVKSKNKGKHIFIFSEPALSKIECNSGLFVGEINNKSATLTLSPIYKECIWLKEEGTGAKKNEGEAEVTSGCKYELDALLKTGAEKFAGSLTLTPAKCVITFHNFKAEPKCEVEIKGEKTPTGLGGVTFENKGGPPPTGLVIGLNLKGIAYVTNKMCPKTGFAEESLLGGYMGEINEEGEGIVVE
jgi:hypothetical protein